MTDKEKLLQYAKKLQQVERPEIENEDLKKALEEVYGLLRRATNILRNP